MAHPIEVKAAALAELLTGESPRRVAKLTGVPLTTVKRWQRQAFAELAPYLGDALAKAAQQLRPR